MRQQLQAPNIDEALFNTIQSLISKIVYGMDDRDFNPAEDIEELHRLSGRSDFDEESFFKAYDMADDGDFARELASGVPEPVLNMTHSEITKILSMRVGEDNRYFCNLLDRSFPNAYVLDLIYSPLTEMTDEETATELLHRQKIFEIGGNEALVTYLRSAAEAVRDNPDSPIWAQMGARSILEMIRLPSIIRL